MLSDIPIVSVFGHFPYSVTFPYLIIFYNVPQIFVIYHNLLQSYICLPKQHTVLYIFTLIAHNIDTPIISELNKLN